MEISKFGLQSDMRFNKQEMFSFAKQPSQNFDKEGVLLLKERQDGFFKRTESEFASRT
jgi:inositol polyphosphate-4-phosphatase